MFQLNSNFVVLSTVLIERHFCLVYLLYNIKYSVEVYIGPGDDKRRAVRVYNVY